MQRWEIKRLWLSLDVEWRTDKSKQHTYYNPKWSDETRKAWAQAEAMAADGWELVAAIPEMGSHELIYEVGIKAAGAGSSYTVGYLFIFKRPK